MFAQGILAKLRVLKGTDKAQKFEEFAKKFSKCKSGPEGGSLGRLGEGRVLDEMDKIIFKRFNLFVRALH